MIVVVGGHSRDIGKTSVVAGLIAALPRFAWTAVKITQFGHGVCSTSGEDCGCSTDPDHPFALTRERDAESGTDTARYLAAGARESYWLRTRGGELGFAMPALRRLLERSTNIILESNSVLQFVRPDLYLVVLDPANADFKATSRLYLDRADAFLLPDAIPDSGSVLRAWQDVAPRLLIGRPFLRLGRGYAPDSDLLDLIESRHKISVTK